MSENQRIPPEAYRTDGERAIASSSLISVLNGLVQSPSTRSGALREKVAEIRVQARHLNYVTVESIARAFESELLVNRCKRAAGHYAAALSDAYSIDAGIISLSHHNNPSQNQEALLASIALRMHG